MSINAQDFNVGKRLFEPIPTYEIQFKPSMSALSPFILLSLYRKTQRSRRAMTQPATSDLPYLQLFFNPR